MSENFAYIKNKMRAEGIQFSALSDSDFLKIEEIYGIQFPRALRAFYRDGIPSSDVEDEFPRWNDFSPENIETVKKRIRAPIEQLLHYLKDDTEYWPWRDRPKEWEDAKKAYEKAAETATPLIPIYLHRYVPVMEGVDDPPILSIAAGFDIVCYGSNLEDYLRREFVENVGCNLGSACLYIPFWSDIMYYNDLQAEKVRQRGRELGLY